ncbi:hypothetical protein BDV98DRAFT_91713 [Pterulicium gracile]|uniref:DUF6535 domain-containing protein n=1 Tax=Pterulicium gracile TaxID=1884261 RepID=A0A5C3PZX8_9AGAR|nr:hypothetical protein BDV98DRAFT_91713 [Pterula gracilis]
MRVVQTSLMILRLERIKNTQTRENEDCLGSRASTHGGLVRKYPADRYGEEMGPSARIWKTAFDETEKHDREMTMGWRDSIDALLVFAGLFSAVISGFLSQTYQALQPDLARITALLLIEQIALMRALADGVSPNDIPITTPRDLDSAVFASSTDYWTHGLWFTGLTLSFITALFAVVMKQWISSYMTPVSGNPLEQVRMRHFRFKGLEKWHVPALFGFLPVLLHISLFLFLAGLVSFLSALNITMAVITALLAGSAFLAYVTANSLPVFYPECPYKTPLSSLARYLWWTLRTGASKLKHRFTAVGRRAGAAVSELKVSTYASLTTLEAQAVHTFRHHLDTHLKVWLYDNSSNYSVKDIVLEAFAGLKSDFTLRFSDAFAPIALEVEAAFNQ